MTNCEYIYRKIVDYMFKMALEKTILEKLEITFSNPLNFQTLQKKVEKEKLLSYNYYFFNLKNSCILKKATKRLSL